MSHEGLPFPVAERPSTRVILIVEDAGAPGVSISHILARDTLYRIFAASDGRAALKFTRYVRPHLFVLRCTPGWNIAWLSHQLHTPVEMRTVPTIVVGTPQSEQLQQFADEVESYGLVVICEPLQVGHLLSAVRELLP